MKSSVIFLIIVDTLFIFQTSRQGIESLRNCHSRKHIFKKCYTCFRSNRIGIIKP